MTSWVVVDADAIVAWISGTDLNHGKAMAALEKIKRERQILAYPATAIAEATTVLQKKVGARVVEEVVALFGQAEVEVAATGKSEIEKALKMYFTARGSKKNTLFDAVVAAVADKYQTKDIFSFDEFYKKKGFNLVTWEKYGKNLHKKRR